MHEFPHILNNVLVWSVFWISADAVAKFLISLMVNEAEHFNVFFWLHTCIFFGSFKNWVICLLSHKSCLYIVDLSPLSSYDLQVCSVCGLYFNFLNRLWKVVFYIRVNNQVFPW
jgi:hypothetical protein